MANCLTLAIWLLAGTAPRIAAAKGSSGGGHSSSSHSSSGGSHSYSSGSHSYGSGGSSHSSSSSGSSKSFSSSSRSYSSGSSHSDNNSHGYSSGKSYGAGSSSPFSSKPPARDSSRSSNTSSSKSSRPDSGFSFDTAAARAQKEQSSKADYTKYKESKAPPVIPSDSRSSSARPSASSGGSGSSGGGWTSGAWRDRNSWDYPRRTYVYVPNVMVIRSRPSRIYNVFGGYTYRPWVTYNDPYSSLFWWWLLDRSLDDQASWAYHHRYDMDPARYQALMANNQQLEARVAQLEAQQQAPRDPSYTPTGLDRDLMYSDHYVAQAYSNRPTRGGSIGFWLLGVPLAAGFCAFLIWLIWFKRWQTAT